MGDERDTKLPVEGLHSVLSSDCDMGNAPRPLERVKDP